MLISRRFQEVSWLFLRHKKDLETSTKARRLEIGFSGLFFIPHFHALVVTVNPKVNDFIFVKTAEGWADGIGPKAMLTATDGYGF